MLRFTRNVYKQVLPVEFRKGLERFTKVCLAVGAIASLQAALVNMGTLLKYIPPDFRTFISTVIGAGILAVIKYVKEYKKAHELSGLI